MKYIKFGRNESLFKVNDIYAFTYDYGEGKTVLRCSMDASTLPFESVKDLFLSGDTVYVYEDKTELINNKCTTAEVKEYRTKQLILEFDNFVNDYKCAYSASNNTWDIEITKKSETEMIVEENNNILLDGLECIAMIFEDSIE